MKAKKLLCVFLNICILLSILSVQTLAADAKKPGIYMQTRGTQEAAYRLSPNGDIQGYIPIFTDIEVTSIDGDWAKVRYLDAEYYVWISHFERIADRREVGYVYGGYPDKDGFIVAHKIKMSAWAQDSLARITNFSVRLGDDWTKPITRFQMAEPLVGIMVDRYGSWSVQMTLPGTVDSSTIEYNDMEYDFAVGRLAYWGVTSGTGNKNYSPDALVTREQMATFLYNIYEYDRVQIRGEGNAGAGNKDLLMRKGNLGQFSDADQISSWATNAMSYIVGEGIMGGVGGGRLAPKDTCTIEQAQIMCDRVYTLIEKKDLEIAAKVQDETNDANYITNGLYTIRTDLSSGAYVQINNNGMAVFSSSEPTHFTITYIRTDYDKHIYTIQAWGGKYLGLAKANAENNEKLMLVDTPYEWEINYSGPFTHNIIHVKNSSQFINAPGFVTTDATPLITYNRQSSDDDSNGKFRFKKVY
ncbi:MAG: S-layer homology domain-containing protein [Eubacteriales bacterium]|nr:S-layer homology domain-containing protein [Eubacteriales bacterium]